MRKNSGFTLSELLVATGIFLLIGIMLVGILRSGLDLWDRGEAHRDVYERGQVILDMMARDLAAAWVDREPASTKDRLTKYGHDTPPWDRPGLTCDRDRLGRQRLVFTKRGRPDSGAGGEVEDTGNAGKDAPIDKKKDAPKKPDSAQSQTHPSTPKATPKPTPGDSGGPPAGKKEGSDATADNPGQDAGTVSADTTPPPDPGEENGVVGFAVKGGGGAKGAADTGQVVQVLYVMDPEPGQRRLWRGTKVFGGGSAASSAAPTIGELEDPDFVHNQLALLSTGVLSVDFAFWSPETRDWTSSPRSGGPEETWDSSRAWDDRFRFYLPDRTKVLSPDILPEMVRISVVLLPEGDRPRGTTIPGPLDASTNKITVDSTRGFPEAPGAAMIDDEWFTYSAKDDTTFTVSERGAKGTRPAQHDKGARVVAGETLSTVVYLACRKSPREDEGRR